MSDRCRCALWWAVAAGGFRVNFRAKFFFTAHHSNREKGFNFTIMSIVSKEGNRYEDMVQCVFNVIMERHFYHNAFTNGSQSFHVLEIGNLAT